MGNNKGKPIITYQQAFGYNMGIAKHPGFPKRTGDTKCQQGYRDKGILASVRISHGHTKPTHKGITKLVSNWYHQNMGDTKNFYGHIQLVYHSRYPI